MAREKKNKVSRIIIRIVLLLLFVLVVNGTYYVFWGQFKSVDRLNQNKELSLYEKLSIYSMHLCICTMGWIYSPEATREIIAMSFPHNRDKTIYKESDFFLKYPIINNRYRTQYSRFKVAFKDTAYSHSDPNHRLALAVNPGYLWRDANTVYLEAPIHYPVCYNTHIGITSNIQIIINECLFTYLEQIRWLHPYTLIYHTEIEPHE